MTPDEWTKIRGDDAKKAELRKQTAPDKTSFPSYDTDTDWQPHPAVVGKLPLPPP